MSTLSNVEDQRAKAKTRTERIAAGDVTTAVAPPPSLTTDATAPELVNTAP